MLHLGCRTSIDTILMPVLSRVWLQLTPRLHLPLFFIFFHSSLTLFSYLFLFPLFLFSINFTLLFFSTSLFDFPITSIYNGRTYTSKYLPIAPMRHSMTDSQVTLELTKQLVPVLQTKLPRTMTTNL